MYNPFCFISNGRKRLACSSLYQWILIDESLNTNRECKEQSEPFVSIVALIFKTQQCTLIEIELVTRPAEFELGIWHWAWPPEMERRPCWLQWPLPAVDQ